MEKFKYTYIINKITRRNQDTFQCFTRKVYFTTQSEIPPINSIGAVVLSPTSYSFTGHYISTFVDVPNRVNSSRFTRPQRMKVRRKDLDEKFLLD